MRIRLPFAGAFLVLVLASAYVGLTSFQIPAVNDKLLHFIAFFLLTLTFYWILDTSRRRALNTTFLLVTVFFGLGSELIQALLPNDRQFDPLDIVANIIGSIFALGLCTLYHKRMLERKRKRKLDGYGIVDGEGEGDLELGEGGSAEQEIGVMGAEGGEGDDEVGEAWDEIGGDGSVDGDVGKLTPSSGSAEGA